MDWTFVLLFILGGVVIMMFTGLPVAFCFMVINVLAALYFWGGAKGLEQLALTMAQSVASFTFLPIPMFILLGEVIFRSGMAMRAIDVVDKWMGRLPGRLALLVVATATLFSTMSGSTVATAAMLGDVLIPEMEKRGYKKSISIGVIMGTGGLAMIIPPSGMIVVWASLADVSVAKLLIAGILPGILMAVVYATYVVGRCWLQPSIAPPYVVAPTPMKEKLEYTAKYLLPLSFVVFMVTGVIVIGVATPSEAAALGALSAVILAAIYGKLSWGLMKKAIRDTLRVTIMILIIISGSTAFGQFLAFSGATREAIVAILELPLSPIMIVIVMQLILLIMGCFMSSLPIMMITLPIFMPIVAKLGVDPIWFGMLFLLNMEIGQETPPFGILLFTMKGVCPSASMGEIIRADIPFILCDLFTLAILTAFPTITTFLPSILVTQY